MFINMIIKKMQFNICIFLSLLLVYLLLIQFKVFEDKETGIEPGLIPAFPGAEGFGSTTAGGRGGRVIEVTNLNAAGTGSFLEACEASGPRIVVFRTGGMINTTNTINIWNPFITIAGQTAPGSGICIGGAGLNIATHDVVIRGIRVRVGDNPAGPAADNRDGIGVAKITSEALDSSLHENRGIH